MNMKYDRTYFADLEKAEKIEYPRNLRILKSIEFFKKTGKLADVGIGTGLFLKIAREHGWDVFGIDISNYALGRVKKNGIKLFQGQLENVSFKDNFFDVVNMRHSIEHMKNPNKVLAKAYKILKPGGIICIATPNSFGIHARIFGEDWPHLSLPYHLHFFSKKSLSRLIKDAGFKILQIKTEELTSYDVFKLLLFRLGLPVKYKNPSRIGFMVNKLLVKMGLGEGLVVLAQKRVK